MNALPLILLAGGAAVVAVAVASSSTAEEPEKTSSEESEKLISSAEDMVRIFELYSQKMATLSEDELNELGRMNAASKGIEFETVLDAMKRYLALPIEHTDQQLAAFTYSYRQTYYLPPDTANTGSVDVFSVWADGGGPTKNVWTPTDGPTLQCTVGGNITGLDGSIGPFFCQRGNWLDWFGRVVGQYEADLTVHGQSDLMFIGQGLYKDLKKAWDAAGPDLAKKVADVASNYPGVGTVIASGAAFLSSIGSGESLENAALSAGRAAVPSALRAAYDIGVGLAVRGELDTEALLSVAMAMAISEGVITGDILEKYNTIVAAYDKANEVGAGLGTLGTAVNLASQQ